MANDKGAQAEKPKKRSRVKETFAELKKVTWPSFGKTMKQTGAVLVVTIFFLIVLLVMDQLLGLAHRELIKGLTDTGETTAALTNAMHGLKASAAALFGHAPAFPILL